MRTGTLRRWENSGNRRKGTSRDYYQSWETLGTQGKGHEDTFTGGSELKNGSQKKGKGRREPGKLP